MAIEAKAAEVVVADPYPIVRYGLIRMFRESDGLRVIAEASDGEETVRLCSELKPNLLVLDIAMPSMSGIEIVRQVKELSPDTKVLILTVQQQRELISFLMQSGADGFLAKDVSVERIVEAATALAEGYGYFGPGAAQVFTGRDESLSGGAARRKRSEEPYDRLTARERQVFQLVAQGRTTREIADILDIRQKTVENHRLRIMRKMKLHRTAELIRYAALKGMLT
ncbi:MAG: response regulator transcription factor [Proteobacteria bacterium]|nr:response regulator transcription factor [Pseudomonadota bacterium]